MPERNADNNYNTNLASEYSLMSLLCRAGKDAYLSLGNKKGVDIIVKTKQDAMCIVEVKGVNEKSDWIICNSGKLPAAPALFYALVCFHGKIKVMDAKIDVWMIPSHVLEVVGEHKISANNKTIYISNKRVREHYDQYRNTFASLDEYLDNN